MCIRDRLNTAPLFRTGVRAGHPSRPVRRECSATNRSVMSRRTHSAAGLRGRSAHREPPRSCRTFRRMNLTNHPAAAVRAGFPHPHWNYSPPHCLSVPVSYTHLMFFRCFSKNIYARRRENEFFKNIFKKIKNFFVLQKNRIRDIKGYRYRKCPHCKAMLRLPKRRGRHTVICPRCKKRFEVKI